jgi:hypothetical protein
MTISENPQPDLAGIIPAMRINLVTPFAEKDAVKALGARWDGIKKCWYIVDVADLAPFARWIPNFEAAVDVSGGASKVTKPKFTLLAPVSTPAKSDSGVADCGCDVLPWDDCVHTTKA